MSSHAVCGLLGFPIGHSLSPQIHNRWFQEQNINAQYSLFEYESAAEAKIFLERFMQESDSLGLNITIPYKEWVLSTFPHVFQDESVARLGAANTLYKRDGKWFLSNTDLIGIRKSIEKIADSAKIANSVVCILGAGGGAKAAVGAAYDLGFKNIVVWARDVQKASHSLAAFKNIRMEPLAESGDTHLLHTFSQVILINTLPIGHSSEVNSYAKSFFESFETKSDIRKCYVDMIYKDTPALLQARNNGWNAINGETMLVEQARASFKLWTNILP